VSINTRIRTTPESFVGNEEVQHQRNRTLRIREVVRHLNVPTLLTPAPSHLSRFFFMGYPKEVSNLVNRPIVSLLGTRVALHVLRLSPRGSIYNFRHIPNTIYWLFLSFFLFFFFSFLSFLWSYPGGSQKDFPSPPPVFSLSLFVSISSRFLSFSPSLYSLSPLFLCLFHLCSYVCFHLPLFLHTFSKDILILCGVPRLNMVVC
jgi:hypothetical protein